MINLHRNIKIFFFAFIIFVSCGENPVPRPRAYFRIALPEKEYKVVDTALPYTFEVPVYAVSRSDLEPGSEPYWLNIDIPQFSARLHLSYKTINGNLSSYIDDAYNMAMKHIPKSTGIREERIEFPENDVYGILYDIRGSGAASPLQFFLTDSSNHFIRAALYFNHSPNNDSLQPVIIFIKEDLLHLCQTLEWKDVEPIR